MEAGVEYIQMPVKGKPSSKAPAKDEGSMTARQTATLENEPPPHSALTGKQ